MISPSCVGGKESLLYHTRLRKRRAPKPKQPRVDRMTTPPTEGYLAALAFLKAREA